MKKPSVDSKGEVIIPKFQSKREESEWFDVHSEFFMARLKKHGKVVAPMTGRADAVGTLAISLRVPLDDIEKAKQIAKHQGIGYQTVLKKAIREGLEKAS